MAVVGAGPAGLSCAHDLALLGYRVTLFDAAPVVGGMLYQGVPEYRLSRDLIRAEVDQILALGVELKLNWRSAATSPSAICAATGLRPCSSRSAPRGAAT